jgi:hypothetical protein
MADYTGMQKSIQLKELNGKYAYSFFSKKWFAKFIRERGQRWRGREKEREVEWGERERGVERERCRERKRERGGEWSEEKEGERERGEEREGKKNPFQCNELS